VLRSMARGGESGQGAPSDRLKLSRLTLKSLFVKRGAHVSNPVWNLLCERELKLARSCSGTLKKRNNRET
jgi:hypothetical protein